MKYAANKESTKLKVCFQHVHSAARSNENVTTESKQVVTLPESTHKNHSWTSTCAVYLFEGSWFWKATNTVLETHQMGLKTI